MFVHDIEVLFFGDRLRGFGCVWEFEMLQQGNGGRARASTWWDERLAMIALVSTKNVKARG